MLHRALTAFSKEILKNNEAKVAHVRLRAVTGEEPHILAMRAWLSRGPLTIAFFFTGAIFQVLRSSLRVEPWTRAAVLSARRDGAVDACSRPGAILASDRAPCHTCYKSVLALSLRKTSALGLSPVAIAATASRCSDSLTHPMYTPCILAVVLPLCSVCIVASPLDSFPAACALT